MNPVKTRHIGNEYKLAIRGKGISQAQAAEMMGISRQHLAMNLSVPTVSDKMQELIKEKLGISIPLDDSLHIVNSNPNNYDNPNLIPVFDVEFTAGFEEMYKSGTNEHIIGYIDFMPEFKGCEAIVRCRNNSMQGVIDPGDWVGIRRIYDFEDIEYKAIYGIVTKNFSLFKYIHKSRTEGMFLVKSANPEYEDREMPITKIVSLWVVQTIVPMSKIKTYI